MEKGEGQLVDAPSFVDICTLHQHAMRYYRLWIYACNIVLALATLVFTLFALSILVDPRISLLSGVELYQPTFIYAYIALTVQCGILQAVGCVGALRLNQRLLNIYWTLLLVLMVGDIFVGLVWAFRLDNLKSTLKPNLRQRLKKYEKDSQFTKTWDWVQTNDVCCGVDGPTDFLKGFNESTFNLSQVDIHGLPVDISYALRHKLPTSCCIFAVSHHVHTTAPPPMSSTPRGTPTTHHSHNSQFRRVSNRGNYFHNFTHISSFGGTSHNRRKIVHSTRKHGPDPSLHPPQHPNRHDVQTTTDSSTRVSHHHPVGNCRLPPELVPKSRNQVFIKIGDTMVDSFHFESSTSTSSEEASGSTLSSNPHSSSSSSSSELPISPHHTDGSIASTVQSTLRINYNNNDGERKTQDSSTSHEPTYTIVSMELNDDGCGERIMEWVDHASDILFVIGFCIIVFLKGCFVAILRYEIKEMIQKIRLLNGEDEGRSAAMNELIGLTSMYERGNDDDPGETEGLMASGGDHGVQQATTNIDAIDSDKRKDSVVNKNCLVGNHVANHSRKTPSGNHVICVGLCSNKTSTTTTFSSHNPSIVTTTTATVGCGGCALIMQQGRPTDLGLEDDANKQSNISRIFRDGNGDRNLPRNGNNNNTNNAGLGGVPTSASAPIPIDSLAKA